MLSDITRALILNSSPREWQLGRIEICSFLVCESDAARARARMNMDFMVLLTGIVKNEKEKIKRPTASVFFSLSFLNIVANPLQS